MGERKRQPIRPRQAGDLYTVEEAASRLRVSAGVIYKLCRLGDLPAMRIGDAKGRGVWRIAEGDLEAFLEKAKGTAGDVGARRAGKVKLKHFTM